MLKIKRVELQGFKSFVDRTELRFRGSGVAAIVGPNGCGKSNLADAISWVLGEQSAKSLRGSRMEDVIFAGTRDRKPLGLASVTMTMVDPDGEILAAAERKSNGHGANGHGANGHGTNGANGSNGTNGANGNGHVWETGKPREVTITRRLFRSGQSEYLIDGRQARLRDIQDIFMGTGLGPESYAIIEQGRITQILSNKPQERRAVIEEAAGVGKFKARRRLAEAKLEGAKQNLARVFDILEEVGRQVNSLKRQAAKARRYGELKEEMLGHLRLSLTGRYQSLAREAARLALELNFANNEYQSLSVEVGEREKEQAALTERAYAVEQELTAARQTLADANIDAERTRGRIDSQARQIAAIEQRLTRGETELGELETAHQRHGGELEAHQRALAEVEEQMAVLRSRLQKKSEERGQAEQSVREREHTLETGRQQVLKLLGEASGLKNQLAQLDEYLASLDRERARSRKEEETAGADIEKLAAQKKDLGDRMAARQLELESVTRERRVVEEDLTAAKNRLSEARRTLERLRGEYSGMKARRDSLAEILSHRSYTTDSVKRLFTAIEKGRAGELKPLGVLADFVEVDAAHEKATEEFLHEELEYVVVRDWAGAEQGIDLMRGDLDGRATFLVHPEPGASIGGAAVIEPALGPETGIVARLSEILRLTNGLTKAPAELVPRLARCFLVEDRAAARRLSLQYPDLYFLLPDGVSYHGHAVSGGKKTGAGPLALKRELREVTARAQAKREELEATQAEVESLDKEIAALAEEQERLRSLQQVREKDALALDHEMRKLGEELNRVNTRLSVARLELDRLERDGARAGEKREQNQAQIETAEARRKEQETKLEAARAELAGFQSAQARLNEEHSALRAELAGAEERRRAGQSSKARIEAQLREIASRRDAMNVEMERLGIDRARLLADNIELDRRAAALAEEIAREEERVHVLAGEERELREALAAAEETLRERRQMVQAAQEKRSQVELDLVRRQAELKYLDETSRKEMGAPIEELAAGVEIEPSEEELEEAGRKYQEVRTRIDALGPVNPQALEEFQEAQQRYDFLSAQRQDLLDSIRDTEKAIQEIDVETRRRFSSAFEAINAHFRETYRILFNGGTGEMRLTDPDNLAESGIDILASPPGKRLQNVLLLSGGERSLTAMALLLAIFRYQPSPFCVLDEVDAALDEANITKLVRLVKEMSAQTQFVLITHAKKTMEAAEAMYGVTMQEPGVSKVVSVRFSSMPEIIPPQGAAAAAAAAPVS